MTTQICGVTGRERGGGVSFTFPLPSHPHFLISEDLGFLGLVLGEVGLGDGRIWTSVLFFRMEF